MRYLALATDFDGTLTEDGAASPAVRAAFERLRATGRKTILVTGRRLGELLDLCACVSSFDLIVAENGALLYRPSSQESILLSAPVSHRLVDALRKRGVQPLEIGEAIIATHVPNDLIVLDAIRETGLELQIIFNRGAVMVLPPGVNKSTGLQTALRELRLSPHEVVSVGDAENDHSFLQMSECSAAVNNAVQSLKSTADIVLSADAGNGVIELIDQLIATDLAAIEPKLTRHHIALGKKMDGTSVLIPPYGRNILIAGPSGSGKSSLASGFVERLVERLYQVCIIDPEGDYVGLPHVVTLGDESRVPSFEEIAAVLRDPGVNLNVNLLGVRLAERPAFFAELLPRLQAMRAQTARPHWMVIDEAHHLMPGSWGSLPLHSPAVFGETILVTVHADHLAPSILPMIDVVVAVGPRPDVTLNQFTTAAGHAPLRAVDWESRENRIACWFTRRDNAAFPLEVILGRAARIRHHRKYAMGELGPRSFYFRGPDGHLNLKAQNLAMFCQIAEGVDDATWLFHLRRKDYSNWLEDVIKDDELADLARDFERSDLTSASESRARLCHAIHERYSLPI